MTGKRILRRLGEICEFRGGQGFPQKHQGASAGDYPFVKVSDMELLGNGYRITKANHWINEVTRKELRAKPHPATSTIFAKIGVALTYNRRRLLSQPTIVDNNMMAAVPKESEVTALFLYYLLRVTDFNKVVSGTALPYLNAGDLANMEVEVPPLTQQKYITGILGPLDEKIELNRKMNETLEQMASALFKSWFVDFDPVHAKATGRQPAGMDKATADLFPDSFMDSELGKIPKGWTSAPVGETVDCQGGATPSTSEAKYWEGGTHHWTTPKDFSSLESPFLLDTDRKLTDAGISKISSGLLPAGTLLLSSRAPIGYIAIATMPVAINQGFIALKCNKTASNFFMLNWCKSNMAEIESRATGTTFPEISKLNFRPILVCLPPKEVMTAFTDRVTPLYAQVVLSLRQSRSLSAIRDALLPGLLSGNISTSPKL